MYLELSFPPRSRPPDVPKAPRDPGRPEQDRTRPNPSGNLTRPSFSIFERRGLRLGSAQYVLSAVGLQRCHKHRYFVLYSTGHSHLTGEDKEDTDSQAANKRAPTSPNHRFYWKTYIFGIYGRSAFTASKTFEEAPENPTHSPRQCPRRPHEAPKTPP